MTLLYPLALLGLIPWAAVAGYVWVRRRATRPTPFLPLWDTAAAPPAGRSVRTPPWPILALLAATLLALLAATGPALPGGRRTINVVIDCGPTMSATGRLASATEALDAALRRAAATDINLFTVGTGPPTPRRLAASQITRNLEKIPFTSIPTLPKLTATLRRTLADSDTPVLVLTDQRLPDSLTRNPRVLPIRPTAAVRNAGIASFSVRRTPRPQAMLRLAGIDRPTTLTLRSAGQFTARRMAAAEATGPLFVDLPALGPTADALLDAQDDFPADDAAWLAQAAADPRLKVSADLPASVRRAADGFSRLRPPGDGGATVAVSTRPPPAGPAVVVADGGGPRVGPGTAVKVVDHPVTRGIRFPPAPSGATPPAGWSPLVTAGGLTLLAVRDGPPRGVWVGIDLAGSRFDGTADFVLLLARSFGWAGGGAGDLRDPEFAAAGPESVRPSWQRLTTRPSALTPAPGLYRDGGTNRAVNVPYLKFPNPPPIDRPVPPAAGRGIDLAPPLALAALAAAVLAFARRRKRSPLDTAGGQD